MQLKKLDDSEMSFKPWPRTLNEAFGPGSKLCIEQHRKPFSEYAWMAAYGVAVAICWYLIVALKAGSQ